MRRTEWAGTLLSRIVGGDTPLPHSGKGGHSYIEWYVEECPRPSDEESTADKRKGERKMRVDVVMPQLGESVIEGVVVKWLVKVGDTVAKDQSLLEISTDKVDAEIPSPAAGRIVEILAKEGDTVPIQEILCRIETEKVADAPPPPPGKWDEEEEGIPGAMARKTGPPIPTAPRAEPPKEIAKPVPPPPAKEGVKVRISPVVAKMAAEYGLDISRIPGTGIEGRVTKKDVEEY
ncbi:MAG: hypothetical protein E4H29_06025, partial [Deltaproteobacteria bacterium]